MCVVLTAFSPNMRAGLDWLYPHNATCIRLINIFIFFCFLQCQIKVKMNHYNSELIKRVESKWPEKADHLVLSVLDSQCKRSVSVFSIICPCQRFSVVV